MKAASLLVLVAAVLRHAVHFWSSAKFSVITFTRGSPKTPQFPDLIKLPTKP